MVAFLAPITKAGDQAYKSALQYGGIDEGQPNRRTNYGKVIMGLMYEISMGIKFILYIEEIYWLNHYNSGKLAADVEVETLSMRR